MLRRSARARDALRTTKPMVEGVWRGDVEETPRIRAKHEAHARHFRDIVTACGRSAFKAEHGHAKGKFHNRSPSAGVVSRVVV